jgi:hypothetical protein
MLARASPVTQEAPVILLYLLPRASDLVIL